MSDNEDKKLTYYEKNKEKVLEYSKKYREAHKEDIKEYREKNKKILSEKHKEYYKQHKEEINRKNLEYQASHPEINKKAHEKYVRNHKEKLSEYNKEYYQKNKEQILNNQINYYHDHADEYKEYNKNYYDTHKEYYQEFSKKYRDEHKQELNDYHKKYLEEHSDEVKEYQKEYQKGYAKKYQEEHKEELDAYHHKYQTSKTKGEQLLRMLRYAFINGYEDDSVEGKIIGCSYNDAMSILKYDYKNRYGTNFDGNFDDVTLNYLFPLKWTIDIDEVILLNGIWNIELINNKDINIKRKEGIFRDNNHPVWNYYETKLDFNTILGDIKIRLNEMYPRTRKLKDLWGEEHEKRK